MNSLTDLLIADGERSLDLDAAARQLAPFIRSWTHRYLGPKADADDCAQEALIEVVAALDRFEGRSKLTTYARRITLRVAADWVKRHRMQSPDPHLFATEDSRDPESIAMGREALRRFYRYLDELSEKRREALVLCDIEKMAHKEAADVCGVDLDTLRARLKNARAQLRHLVASDPYLGPLCAEAP